MIAAIRTRVTYGVAGMLALVVLVIGALSIRYRPRAEREDPALVAAEIRQLTQLRDSLRGVVYDAALTSDVLDGRPMGDIAIGLPTPFVDTIVRSVIVGWFHEVDLRLPHMRIRKTGDVHARLGIFGRRRVGTYALDVGLDGVHGTLQPGIPTLRFGGDMIAVTVPVRITGGTGVAHVKAEWDARGFTGPVCGDMSAERDVTGQVRARDYVARGQLRLSAVDGALQADPDFPALAIRLFIDPARSSVAALDSLLESRGGLCGYAIGKSHASERIQAMVARGFRVRIPQRFFRPVHLPVAVQTSVPVAEKAIALEVTPSGIAVTPSTVWLAANVALRGAAAAKTP